MSPIDWHGRTVREQAARVTGLLEVANFSEEIADAQLRAQRRCRLDLGPWALKFNHALMINIALDTLIGRRLQNLVLAEVCCIEIPSITLCLL